MKDIGYTSNVLKIGLTYDLRDEYLAQGFGEEETAEFDQADTIDAIEQTLHDLGYETDRIGNIWNLTARLAKGDRWDLVFNIAEGLRGIGREAQVPALLDAYDIPYTFSDALVLALTLHKGMTKRVLRDLGIPTPEFVEIQTLEDVERVDLPYPLFAKPIAEGTGKGVTAASKIHTKQELMTVCQRLLLRYGQPVLVETFLPGREFTVGILGTGKHAKAIGVMEVILKPNAEKDVYSYFNKENYKEVIKYHLVENQIAKKAEEIALAAWRGLGCRDAGRIDLRTDANDFINFIEVNPLAGLHPVNSDLCILCKLVGISYQALIKKIICEARKRFALSKLHFSIEMKHLEDNKDLELNWGKL